MSEQNPGNGYPPGPEQPQQQQTPGYPAPQDAPEPQGYPAPQGYPGAAPARPAGPSPLAGIAISDYVMDGVAALLLLVSLALPWNLENRATGRIEVVLILVLSLLSISVHYLARFGVFPAAWKPSMVAALRAALNAPFLLLVLTYVVIDVVSSLRMDGSVGVGGAAALGLAGALLAAVPRKVELENESGPGQVNLWLRIFTGLSALAVGLQLIAIISFLVSGMTDYMDATRIILVILVALTMAAIAGWALVGVVRRDSAWRLVVVALGASAVLAFLFLWSSEGYFGNDALSTTATGLGVGQIGLAYAFLPALGALALTPVLKQAMKPRPELHVWIDSAKNASGYVSLVAGSTAVVTILRLIAGDRGGAVIVLLIFSLIIAVGGVLAGTSLKNNVVSGRNPALIVTGALTLFALISLIMAASSDSLTGTLEALLLAFGLPALIFIALTVPKPVRGFYAANAPTAAQQGDGVAQNGQPFQPTQQQHQNGAAPQQPWEAQQATPVQPWEAQQQAQPQPQPPVQQEHPVESPQPPAQQVPAHGFTAAQAADPSTNLGVLAQIVQEAPELRAAVASNPSTYPDLLNWLAALNDPEVSAALAARQD